jgi:hypothetical protein
MVAVTFDQCRKIGLTQEFTSEMSNFVMQWQNHTYT